MPLNSLKAPLVAQKHKLTIILESLNLLHRDTLVDLPAVVENGAHQMPQYQPGLEKTNEVSIWQYIFIFFASGTSALDFLFGASDAILRYWFGSIEFFQINAILSAVFTNFFFNWMAYLDLFEDNSVLSNMMRVFAMFAATATIAPYFFIGFVGSVWRKAVVVISTAFSLPVFYFGALDFYNYFHASFVQQIRWMLRCSPENFYLALKKGALVYQLTRQYKVFSCATKEKRTEFIDNFFGLAESEKLMFLINQNHEAETRRSWLRWLFCAGDGPVIGTAVLAQNLGHVVLTMYGILDLKDIPVEVRWPLAVLFGLGNLVPSIGYSFATMANFDLIDFLRAIFFLDVPQVQRVIEKDSLWAMILTRVSLPVFRYFYITSGFNNDEVNWQGAKKIGANSEEADIAGYVGNLSGAVVFNGVLNEKLFKKAMMWIAMTKADQEDKRQINFEKIFIDIVSLMMTLPLQDIREMQTSEDAALKTVYKQFFSDNVSTLYGAVFSKEVENPIQKSNSNA